MRRQVLRDDGADYEIHIYGDRRTPLRDFYHALLRQPWRTTIATIALVFVSVNGVFALAYARVGGVANARPGSFADAFYFSVQTMATIGYGAMYPESAAAHGLVVLESIVGLTLTALATGLVFAKFSRPSARILFTRQAVIRPMDGVPTLMLRLGNQRGNRIVDAHLSATLTRTERTHEGETFYRTLDLPLTRSRALSMQRSWTVMHVIDGTSPLGGATPELLDTWEAEVTVMVVGLDDTSMQTVHASHNYYARDILWGSRHADVLSELPDGTMVLDLRKFHDVEPTEPTAGFPYPKR